MRRLRFVRKTYGRGWTPSSWQGRLLTTLYLIFVIRWVFQFPEFDGELPLDNSSLLNFLVPLIVATIVLIIICYIKGEEPRWQWGKEKK